MGGGGRHPARPGIRRLANWGYDRFATNRHRVSAALGMRACQLPEKQGR